MITNNQSIIRIDAEQYTEFLEAAAREVFGNNVKTISVAFVEDEQIRQLNSQYRGIDRPTDVLAFDLGNDVEDSPDTGEVVISLETAERQAAENDIDLETEVKQLILHGVIHLAGYDHETDDGEMNRLELKLRDKLKINQ